MAIKNDGVFTYHILQDRERKNLAILELIRKRSPISKAEISRTLGFNIVTITNYLDYYINKRMVLEVGLDVSTGGRRPELLELNARSGYVAGVDMGPEAVSAVVADLKIKVVSQMKIARPSGSMENLIPEVIKIIADTVSKSKIDIALLKNIGIGMSGIVDYYSGTIRDTDPLRGRTRVGFLRFIKAIEDKFNIPVYIGNDASCAAFGEKALNPGADVDNMLYMYSDVGSGLVVHGDVYVGSSGCAGETQLAFENSPKDEKLHGKEYAYLRPAGTSIDLGVVAAARRVLEKGLATDILKLAGGSPDAITKEMVIEAARKGDKVATEIMQEAGRILGVKAAYLINFFNPAVVVIGGGLERAGDIFMNEVKAGIKRFAFEEPASIVKVAPSMIGDNAVVLGAAALAAREVFIQA
jgi:predicted NBD/HSP70 family sugar kinase